jgi:hypothetical protein
MLDTRLGLGQTTAGPLGADKSLTLKVAGVGSAPANASGAALAVTVFGNDQQSFVTVWPSGGPRPGTSLVNPQPGLVLSQASNVGLGNGSVDIYNAVGSTQVVVDLVGYYQNTTDDARLGNVAHYISGAVDPTTQGVIGDIYLNTTSHTLFGPKTGGEWGTSTNLNSAGLVAQPSSYVNWAYPTFKTWLSVPEMTLTLPPGKWFVQGKGDQFLTNGATVTRLQNTTANQTLDAINTSLGANQTGMIGWSLGTMVNLTATTNIELQVNATAAGSVDYPKLFATPLSSINGA